VAQGRFGGDRTTPMALGRWFGQTLTFFVLFCFFFPFIFFISFWPLGVVRPPPNRPWGWLMPKWGWLATPNFFIFYFLKFIYYLFFN
jgi:hypothetical protein